MDKTTIEPPCNTGNDARVDTFHADTGNGIDKTEKARRQSWMSLLSKAPEGSLEPYLGNIDLPTDFTWLRRPEVGSVMVRGRTSGTGAAFNLGEMTITRCALKLTSGQVGHGYVQGRRKQYAEVAALIDALMQTKHSETVQMELLAPLRTQLELEKHKRSEKAANTKVDFFTMVRGED